MSATITEPAPQTAIFPPAAAMALVAEADGPADKFTAMLAAALDTKTPPPITAADPPAASHPKLKDQPPRQSQQPLRPQRAGQRHRRSL